jgi:hypothetical protein
MTFTLVEVLLIILTLAVIGIAVSVIRTAGRVSETSAEATRTLKEFRELSPRVRATIDAVECRAQEARAITVGARHTADQLSTAAERTNEILGSLSETLVDTPRRYEALVSGAVTGFRVLRDHFTDSDETDSPSSRSNGRFSRDQTG